MKSCANYMYFQKNNYDCDQKTYQMNQHLRYDQVMHNIYKYLQICYFHHAYYSYLGGFIDQDKIPVPVFPIVLGCQSTLQ